MATRHIPESVKLEVLMRSNGRCPECDSTEGPFHFHHRDIPYSVKPVHEAWNISVWCAKCNLKKGAKMTRFTIDRSKLYEWQDAALTALDAFPWMNGNDRQAALAYLATGSGKTWLCLAEAFREAERSSGRVLIVVPNQATSHRYKDDWPKARGSLIVGASLPDKLPILTGSTAKPASLAVELAASPVVVVTVMWLVNRLKSKPTWAKEISLVIFEEGHHIAADVYRTVVESLPSAKLLYATGTPVRADKELLPRVPYSKRAVGPGQSLVEYELKDLAEMTGIMGARFTLADAVARLAVKRVSRDTTCVPVEGTDLKASAADTEFSGTSLDNLRANAKKEGLAINVFTQQKVRLDTFALARKRHLAILRKYPAKKWKAVCKVARIDDAYQAEVDARAAGWNPVVVHGETTNERCDEENITVAMKARLARFDAPSDPVDLCIQVNTLTEGYNNPAVYMCIWLCNVESDVTVAQFNGRAGRLFSDIDYREHPDVHLVFANVEPLRRKQERYVALANELEFLVGTGTGPGPQPGEVEWATLDDGKFFILGEDWDKAEAERDPVRDAVNELLGKENANEAIRRKLEDQVRSGALMIPGLDVQQAQPLSSDDAGKAWGERRKDIASWLARNGFQHRAGRSETQWKALLFKSTNATINNIWPGLKRGMKNESLDIGQLREFLDADIDVIRTAALKTLRELNLRGQCRDGAA